MADAASAALEGVHSHPLRELGHCVAWSPECAL
jgi:hypothetical protein